MATLYWHNVFRDNDAKRRDNYTTDQGSTTPAESFSVVNARYWRVQVDAVFATLASGVQEFYLYDGSSALSI